MTPFEGKHDAIFCRKTMIGNQQFRLSAKLSLVDFL